MKLDDAIKLIRGNLDALQRLGVRSISIFGSTARGEAREDSDIDILVDVDDRCVGLFGLAEVQHYLESLLKRRVDLATPSMLRPRYRDQILKEAVRAA